MGNPELDRNARRRDTAMDYETCPNLVHLFFSRAAEKGDRPFLWAKRNGIYAPLGWRQTAETVSRLAAGLKSLGVAKGDRVMLVAENRPEWLIADVAIMAAGGITVPAYTTNTVQDHHHILTDSGAKGAIVSGDRLARNLLPAARESGTMGFVIGMEPIGDEGGDGIAIHAWEDLLAGAEADVEATAAAAPWRRDDTACIIYTSGTGGAPKGVMLHHGAILHNCRGAYDFLLELGLAEETFLSFLPLSHSYEHTAGQFFPISIGAQIYYAEGVETLSANLQEARPTLMTAVPRLYEMMRGRILRGVTAQGGLKEKLFLRAVDVGRKRIIEPRQLSLADRLLDPLLEKAVRNKVRQRFGGRLKALVSGGAPLNPDVGLFFSALGMRVLQGYGQTESAPVISLNRPNKVKMHTVGTPLSGVDVKIAEDGEILVQGELVMQGYWGNPQATGDTIRDGWLHTGDIGRFDQDGYLEITDRKKDIIVNSGGDNLSPQKVEGLITLQPEFLQAMVHGDRRPHLVALLVVDHEWATTWARENGKPSDMAGLAADEDFRKAMAAAIARVNDGVSLIEKVRHFLMADEPFTVENEQMTPTLKVRRHKIREVYGDRLDALYG